MAGLATPEVEEMSEARPGWQADCEFAGLRLKSAFQAIHDLEAGAVVGHSARVRAYRDSEAVPPLQLFDEARPDTEIVRLDRLCRVLHATNYHADGRQPTRLLVPVHPRLLESVTADHGRVYRDTLNGSGLSGARIVICLPDPSHLRTMSLGYLIGSYRLHGFEIAVHLRHAGGLKDLLARTRPTFILLDSRQFDDPLAMAGAIGAAQEAGSRPVFTKVETDTLAEQIRTLGGKLAQGYYFDTPAA
jgi:EAL domain-containing protein (putative c-di-GMP-specific phosphodiesterase class I)